MDQPAPGKPYQVSHITFKGQNLQAVNNFNYMGSTLSREVNIDTEVNNRIAKASSAFESLREKVGSEVDSSSSQSSTSIMQWYLLPSYTCMQAGHGRYTAESPDSSTTFIAVVFADPFASNSRTKSH